MQFGVTYVFLAKKSTSKVTVSRNSVLLDVLKRNAFTSMSWFTEIAAHFRCTNEKPTLFFGISGVRMTANTK